MMLDRATTNTIIAAAGLAGDRAQVVRLAARMTDDATALRRLAALLPACDETTVAMMVQSHEQAWAKVKRERGARR